MTYQHHTITRETGSYFKIVTENTYVDDINKVYIPHRPILEMELVLSSLLAKENYELLSKLPYTDLNVDAITKELGISPQSVFHAVFERFFRNVQQLVPIASYARTFNRQTRFGNVDAYTKSRIPVFYVLDRLKAKLLILKNFLEHLRTHHYLLSSFPSYRKKGDKRFKSILFAEYCSRMQLYFETITFEPEYKSKYLKSANQVNYKFLCELCKFQIPSNHMDVLYIMRGIRSSFLLSKIVFKLLDVTDPFVNDSGSVEMLILNRDIIPGMLDAIGNAYFTKDNAKIRELVNLFEKYLSWMIKGINNGYAIASNSRIDLDTHKTLYYSGTILEFI